MSYDELNDYSILKLENAKLKNNIKILKKADSVKEELLNEYRKDNSKIESSYNDLLHKYSNLFCDYGKLLEKYDDILQKYNSLDCEYEELKNDDR